MSYLEQHYNEIFKKYSDEELIKDIFSYVNGGGNLNKTLSHFLKNVFMNVAERNPIYLLWNFYKTKKW